MIPSCKNVWWRGIRPYGSSTHECSSCWIGLNSQYIASDGSKLLQLVVGAHTQSLASIPLGKCCIRFQSLSNCSLDQSVKLYDLCLQKTRGVSWSWVTLLQTLVKAGHKKSLIIMLLKPSCSVLGCRFLLASLQIRSFRFWEGCPRQRLLPGLKWRSFSQLLFYWLKLGNISESFREVPCFVYSSLYADFSWDWSQVSHNICGIYNSINLLPWVLWIAASNEADSYWQWIRGVQADIGIRF
jgi:hypothetical protein